MVDVKDLRDGDLASGEALEQGTLAAAVATDKTIMCAGIQFDGGVLDQVDPVEGQREGRDLNISGARLRGQGASGGTARVLFLDLISVILRCERR